MRRLSVVATCWLAGLTLCAQSSVEILKPVGALPAHLTVGFANPRAFVETTTGEAIVLDAGAHALYLVDAKRLAARRLLTPGSEWGHILKPTAFALGAQDIFAIADAPGLYDRIQYFATTGTRLGGFYPPGVPGIRLTVGPLVLNGIGAMQFTGQTFLLSAPNTGALMMEVRADGQPIRSIGALRPTGQEADRSLHLALNAGLPLLDPTGGFYFVFQTGVPMFRKYDATGTLLFERHIEGVELDVMLRSMPTVWPKRPDDAGTAPYTPALVETAAVDRTGQLWVALSVPYTYVYNRSGDKIRTVQFQATGVVSPTSLFFAMGDRLLVTPGCYEFSSR